MRALRPAAMPRKSTAAETGFATVQMCSGGSGVMTGGTPGLAVNVCAAGAKLEGAREASMAWTDHR